MGRGQPGQRHLAQGRCIVLLHVPALAVYCLRPECRTYGLEPFFEEVIDCTPARTGQGVSDGKLAEDL